MVTNHHLVKSQICFCSARLLHFGESAPDIVGQVHAALGLLLLVERRGVAGEEDVVEEGEGGVASERETNEKLKVELPLVPRMNLSKIIDLNWETLTSFIINSF